MNNGTDSTNSENEKYDIVYSDYGYIKINPKDLETLTLIPFESIDNTMKGTVHKGSIPKELKLRIKPITSSKRTIQEIPVTPSDTFNSILTIILSKDPDIPQNKAYSLISTKGIINEVKLDSMVHEAKISNGQLLLLVPRINLKFSNEKHGVDITIINSITAYKNGSSEDEIALISKGVNNTSMTSMYIEFSIQSDTSDSAVVIGVVTKTQGYLLQSIKKDFWGYILSDAKKIHCDNGIEYGKIVIKGDKVGMSMELKSNGIEIAFYLNQEYLGIAFDGLDENEVYYPCVSLYYAGSQVTIVEDAVKPPIKKMTKKKVKGRTLSQGN